MPAPSAVERFWSCVLKTDDCWLWQGSVVRSGYGRFWCPEQYHVPAHRYAYELTYGLILPCMFCLHHCDIRLCVRPEHIFLGTKTDNSRDMRLKNRHGSFVHPEKILRGTPHGMSKLTENQIREIRQLYATGAWSDTNLARRFGVDPTNVALIVQRRAWTHVD